MAAATFAQIKQQLAKGEYRPVYLLHGEEGYYIDELVKLFEQIVPEDQRDFNHFTFYAPQTDPARIIDCCMGVPMMAERQVVIVKEAQSDRADRINKLHTYVRNPQPSTILVICFRGQKAKGKDLLAAAKKTAVVFESTKIRDYQAPPIIEQYIRDKGLRPNAKAVEMLRDYVGTDLSRLTNEINKLAEILGEGAEVTPEAVERYIGISKDYNSFELVDAIAARDAAKTFRIANYFASNPKAEDVQVLDAVIFNFFADLLVAIYTPEKTEQALMQALKLKWPMQLRRYRTAMQKYSARQVIAIIDAVRTFDAQSKGIGSRQDRNLLFSQLLHNILSNTGQRLPV